MSSVAPVISVKQASVSYSVGRSLFSRSTHKVLSDISFDLYHGESLGVIGRNGVGKSTLLRLLAGLIVPNDGVVENSGVQAALLALQAGFNNEVSGRSNILLNGLLLGYSQDVINACSQDIVKFSELGGKIDQPVKTYSAGMRARLGFSICFHLRPDVFLIDEVLGVGDAQFRKKSAAAMAEMIRSDQTVVLVSHNPATVKELCDRAVWIEHGQCQMVGLVDDVMAAYQDYVETVPAV